MPRKRHRTEDETPFEKACRWLDLQKGAMLSLMAELTSRNAVGPANGGPGEKEKADFLETYLKAAKLEPVERLTSMDGSIPRPNLVFRLRGSDSSRCIWFMTHLDVVPAGNLDQWRSDPFTLRVEGDKMVGRGVEDNHQGLVASVFATRALIECGFVPPCDIGLLFVSDEETGSNHGIKFILRERRDLFGPKDAFIVPDAGNTDGSLVEVAEKSILWLRFRTVGRQVHASTPHLGKNAFTAASHLVVHLGSLYERFDLRDPMFEPPMSTFEPTRHEKNVDNINTVPGEDCFYLDCRILPQVSVDDVIAAIREICQEVEHRHRVVIKTEVVQREDGAPPTSPEAPIVKSVIEAVRRVYRVEAKPKGIGGGTVAAILRRHGFDAVVWSRIDDTAHSPNEYAWIENMIGDAKVFARVMLGALADKVQA